MTDTNIDKEILKVLQIAGIAEPTEADIAYADTFLARTQGNVMIAARMLLAYKKGKAP
jgi:hypothetical protein